MSKQMGLSPGKERGGRIDEVLVIKAAFQCTQHNRSRTDTQTFQFALLEVNSFSTDLKLGEESFFHLFSKLTKLNLKEEESTIQTMRYICSHCT